MKMARNLNDFNLSVEIELGIPTVQQKYITKHKSAQCSVAALGSRFVRTPERPVS
jgi:hypothetical protein